MDNRTLILERAIDLFSTRSYETVGVRQIAEDAGVTKPTLYHYFGSKQGLIEEILNDFIAPFIDRAAELMVFSGDVMGVLRATAEHYRDFALKHRRQYRLYKSMTAMPEASDSFKLSEGLLIRETALFEELFAAIAEEHGNIGGRYKVYGATFKGNVETYVRMVLQDFQYSEEDLLFRLLHQCLHGIFS